MRKQSITGSAIRKVKTDLRHHRRRLDLSIMIHNQTPCILHIQTISLGTRACRVWYSIVYGRKPTQLPGEVPGAETKHRRGSWFVDDKRVRAPILQRRPSHFWGSTVTLATLPCRIGTDSELFDAKRSDNLVFRSAVLLIRWRLQETVFVPGSPLRVLVRI